MDVAADELDLDPAEIRFKNFIPEEAFPITTLGGANYDSGDYSLVLNKALDEANYQSLLAEQQMRREQNSVVQLGIGIAAYVEITAPTGLQSEYGAVEVNEDGTVTARVGTLSLIHI